MYRLVLYYLVGLLAVAIVGCAFGVLPFNPLVLLASAVILTIICWATNTLFASVFKIPANVESAYITALILALIISPAMTTANFLFLGWAGILAITAKYLLTIKQKHFFNPAAIAVVITALVLNQSASWWVGTMSMSAFVCLGGLLIVRKVRRTRLVISFFISALVVISAYTLAKGGDVLGTLPRVLVNTPIFFFAFVMLTEPLTMPPRHSLQIMYGALVGLLFAPQNHLGLIYSTPELALVIGNIFSYAVSPKMKLLLKFKAKIQQTPDVYDFVFTVDRPVKFIPGQYLEWTLGHDKPDNRGNRRYFTIASSPTEPEIMMGVKFYDKASSFKQQLLAMNEDTIISASQLAGDFTLPKNAQEKSVFIAGGIGVTPFRSMIKYLLDTKQPRDIVMFYSNRTASDIAYKDIFDQAVKDLKIKVVYTLSEASDVPANWRGQVGKIDATMIKAEVPDYLERIFYLSGPRSMVDAFKKVLLDMGVSRKKIRTDFFPGFA